jgi:hypothetical protein
MSDEQFVLKPPPEPEAIAKRPHAIRERLDKTAIAVASAAVLVSMLAATFSFLQWRSSKRQVDIAEKGLDFAKKSAQEQAEDVRRARRAAEDSALAASALVKAATLGAYATKDVALAAAIAATTGQVALTTTQRAFFVPGDFRTLAILEQGKVTRIEFTLQWANNGPTATNDARMRINFRYGPDGLPVNFGYPDYGEGANGPFFVGPGATALTVPVSLPVEAIAKVSNGSGRVYFWGWAAYHDSLRDTRLHVTEFCRELTKVYGDVANGDGLQFQFTSCILHNCLDASCPDYATQESHFPKSN